MTSPHYIGCVSADGGQQGRQNRNDEIDDGLPDLLLIIVHNSIELICLLIKTTEQILIDHRLHRFHRFTSLFPCDLWSDKTIRLIRLIR